MYNLYFSYYYSIFVVLCPYNLNLCWNVLIYLFAYGKIVTRNTRYINNRYSKERVTFDENKGNSIVWEKRYTLRRV